MPLLRPVLAGCIRYTDLLDGSPLDLADIALLNDALDVQAENQRRYDEQMLELARERR
jgi:hypothetical protein